MRVTQNIPLPDSFYPQPLGRYPGTVYLNSNGQGTNLLALGRRNEYQGYQGPSLLSALDHATRNASDWLFGYFSYDLKNHIENLNSSNEDFLGFPLFHLWQPEVVLEWDHQNLSIHHLGMREEDLNDLLAQLSQVRSVRSSEQAVQLVPSMDKNEYLQRGQKLIDHIKQGDIYEVNFCQAFVAKEVSIDPWQIYCEVNEATQAPYSCFMEDRNRYCLSASPELFLQKKGDQLISSPIKGTIKRGSTPQLDEANCLALKHSQKEQSENVMIVDLVRNDLSRVCRPGSVRVDELMHIKTLKTVHQMVSTISGRVNPGESFLDILRATFPMGSMTGAPKIRAMELADEAENNRRGLYSGSIGFFRPNGDFTFNVVIRSLCYNSLNGHLSLMTGSALTAKSDLEAEYDEVLLKAKAIVDILAKSPV